jgi:hypothetical protein
MLKTRLINAAFIVAIVAGLAVMFLYVMPLLSRLRPATKITGTPSMLEEVQTLSNLVTVRYVIEKVVILEDVQPFKDIIISGWGDNRVLMVAHGIVNAGINLGELKNEDIQVTETAGAKKKVSIKLPPARVMDKYLDDKLTKVVEYKTGILRGFDKDLEQNARQQAVADIDRAAREEGILKDAQDKAKVQLTNLFHQLGFEEVEFRTP